MHMSAAFFALPGWQVPCTYLPPAFSHRALLLTFAVLALELAQAPTASASAAATSVDLVRPLPLVISISSVDGSRSPPRRSRAEPAHGIVEPTSPERQSPIERHAVARGRMRSELRVGPAAQQIVIAARERDDGGMVRHGLVHLVDRHVEIEEQRPMRIVPHHALDPEERGEAHPARHGIDAV